MDIITIILQHKFLIASVLIAIPVLGGLGWYLYARTDYFQGPGEKEFKEHIRNIGRNHDVVAEVEWKDGTITYMGADYDVDGENLELENGLQVELPGQSGNPVQLYGMPMIRTSAHVAAPFDTELAIAAEKEEDGDYRDLDERGNELEQRPGEDMAAIADGGGQVADREYEWGGTAFSLTSLWERAPAVSERDLRKQFELGKEYARSGHDRLKTHALAYFAGIGTLLLIIFFIWLLGQIGGGSLL